jgi:hypothetical protein
MGAQAGKSAETKKAGKLWMVLETTFSTVSF